VLLKKFHNKRLGWFRGKRRQRSGFPVIFFDKDGPGQGKTCQCVVKKPLPGNHLCTRGAREGKNQKGGDLSSLCLIQGVFAGKGRNRKSVWGEGGSNHLNNRGKSRRGKMCPDEVGRCTITLRNRCEGEGA